MKSTPVYASLCCRRSFLPLRRAAVASKLFASFKDLHLVKQYPMLRLRLHDVASRASSRSISGVSVVVVVVLHLEPLKGQLFLWGEDLPQVSWHFESTSSSCWQAYLKT